MKTKKLVSAMIMAGALFGATQAGAQVVDDTRTGYVTGVETIWKQRIVQEPVTTRSCETVRSHSRVEGNVGDVVIGGLIGSAIGNKLSNNEGAGAAGTVAGAILGREQAKNATGQREIVGYRQQDVCETRTIMTEQTVQEITGYRNTIEIDNKIIMLESARPLAPNERIEINRQVTYSLR